MPKNNIGSQLFKSISCILCFIALPIKSYAYLDLGTGSYFIQLAIATLLAGLYTPYGRILKNKDSRDYRQAPQKLI